MENKLSRDSRNIIVAGTSLFIIATASTMTLEAGSDGWSTFGFPLTFYRYTNGKAVHSAVEFKLGYLMVDILLAFSVAIVLFEGLKKIRKQKPA